MNMTRSLLLGVVAATIATFSTTVAQAQDAEAENARIREMLQQKAEYFLDDVANDEIQAAYEDLLKDGPLKDFINESALADKTGKLKTKYGRARDFQLVQSESIGKNLVVMKYLQEFSQFPVVWYFTFYRTGEDLQSRNDKDWVVVTVRFDTNLEGLLTAATPDK